ncbi:hypothetical protein L3X38_003588 [Prunus dulcis]|uniref:Uncharacterized protein n=1 Tax=Prunus dulcis TaxID=3755 RepID=A0AAD4ZMD1_PRUDU|nr:hypothetical protein L3X38_003588 [Prunus dulcis]
MDDHFSPQKGPQTPSSETLNEDSNKKRTRGKSCGKGLPEYVEANGGKRVTLPFNSILQVPINRIMSGKFTTEVGCIVRSHAPVCHDGWKKVSETDKKKLWEALLVKFDLDLAKDDMLIHYIDDKMSTAYTRFKHRLHNHYKKCKTPEEGRAKFPKPDWLCDFFKDPNYQEKMKQKRDDLKARLIDEAPEGTPFDSIEWTEMQTQFKPNCG